MDPVHAVCECRSEVEKLVVCPKNLGSIAKSDKQTNTKYAVVCLSCGSQGPQCCTCMCCVWLSLTSSRDWKARITTTDIV